MDALVCSKCKLQLYGLKQLQHHYRMTHSVIWGSNYKNGFRCGNDGCQKNFFSYCAYMRHVKAVHISKSSYDSSSSSHLHYPVQQHESIHSNFNKIGFNNKNETNDTNVCNSTDQSVNNTLDIAACASKMIANLRLNPTFTAANIDRVIESSELLLCDVMEYVEAKVTEFLEKENFEIKSEKVQSLFKSLNIKDPFKSIRGIDGQIDNLKKHFKFIEPKEIRLGTRFDQRFNRSKKLYEPKQVVECLQFASITETLKLIMSHKEVAEHIKSEKSSDDGYLRNFRDGESFKEHPFFQKYPQAIRLKFFFDEAVVNNALGSKTQPHKLAIFNIMAENAPEYINNYLGGIHVVTLCYASDITKYGMAKVLAPILYELKKLESEEGVEYEVNGEKQVLGASLACVCGDALAAHQLFGLLSPSARHFCRLCMVSREQLKQGVWEDFPRRTKESYTKQLNMIRQNLASTTSTGLREDSPFHILRYFHCTRNFIFDPMHDILEGIGPLVLKLVIYVLLFSKNPDNTKTYDIDVKVLNDRIHLFQYGKFEIKNKPSSNFSDLSLKNVKDHTISQKAVQLWCLLRVFPFLVSDKVPEGDQYLQLILLLNRINEIVFAPKLHVSIIPYLYELIFDFENLFHKLFPHIDRINKFHHVRHYPESILKSGPLRHLSCLLFESKHSFFNRYGSICHNYQNIPKTLMKVNQIYQTANWGMSELSRQKITSSTGIQISIKNAMSCNELVQLGYARDISVLKTCKTEVYGMLYEEQSLVVLDAGIATNEGLPIFGMIQEIIVTDKSDVLLFCKEWPSCWLEESLNSYCVAEGKNNRLINTNDLCDTKPFSLWSDYKSNYSYICLRHTLV